MSNGQKNGMGIRKILITIISILAGALITYSVVFISYNYAQDEKREDKNQEEHKEMDGCVKEIDKKVVKNTVNIETIREDVKEIKKDTREILRRLPK